MRFELYEEHDGTWTWSIESGEPFEDDHRILDRGQGYRTRKAAKEAMLAASARLEETPADSSEPARARPRPATVPTDGTHAVAEAAERSGGRQTPIPADDLRWAVIVEGETIALFVSREHAEKFGRDNFSGKCKIMRVKYGITLVDNGL